MGKFLENFGNFRKLYLSGHELNESSSKYESFKMNDIENIDRIEDEKYLLIIEYFCALITDPDQKLKLNIPIDITYVNEYMGGAFKQGSDIIIKDEDKYITNGREYPTLKHYNMIESMWMSLSRQHFKEFKDEPYFIIKLLSEEGFNQSTDVMIIRSDKSNQPIINAMYKHVKDNEEVIYGKKFNL